MEDPHRSTKRRMGQRMQESMGLIPVTTDQNFVAARGKVHEQSEKIAKLKELFEERDAAMRKVRALESEIYEDLESLAETPPIKNAAIKLRQDHERRGDRDFDDVRSLLSRWHSILGRADLEIKRDYDSARLQLDHYARKSDHLKKQKDKRDLSRGVEARTANDDKADERCARNERKHLAAQRDFHQTTASSIRAYDAILHDKWHDLVPILQSIVDFHNANIALVDDAAHLRQGAADILSTALPNVVPLNTRIVTARAGGEPVPIAYDPARPSLSSSETSAPRFTEELKDDGDAATIPVVRASFLSTDDSNFTGSPPVATMHDTPGSANWRPPPPPPKSSSSSQPTPQQQKNIKPPPPPPPSFPEDELDTIDSD